MGYYILFPNHTWECWETPESALTRLRTVACGHQGAIVIDAAHLSDVMDFDELKRFQEAQSSGKVKAH